MPEELSHCLLLSTDSSRGCSFLSSHLIRGAAVISAPDIRTESSMSIHIVWFFSILPYSSFSSWYVLLQFLHSSVWFPCEWKNGERTQIWLHSQHKPERHSSSPNLRRTCRYLSKQSSVWLRVFMKYSVSLVSLWSPLVTQSAQRGEQKTIR